MTDERTELDATVTHVTAILPGTHTPLLRESGHTSEPEFELVVGPTTGDSPKQTPGVRLSVRAHGGETDDNPDDAESPACTATVVVDADDAEELANVIDGQVEEHTVVVPERLDMTVDHPRVAVDDTAVEGEVTALPPTDVDDPLLTITVRGDGPTATAVSSKLLVDDTVAAVAALREAAATTSEGDQ